MGLTKHMAPYEPPDYDPHWEVNGRKVNYRQIEHERMMKDLAYQQNMQDVMLRQMTQQLQMSMRPVWSATAASLSSHDVVYPGSVIVVNGGSGGSGSVGSAGAGGCIRSDQKEKVKEAEDMVSLPSQAKIEVIDDVHIKKHEPIIIR